MTIRLIIAYGLNLFDLAVSTYWVKRFGVEIESNPVGRWLYETGMVWPVKIFLMGALLFALYSGIKTHPEWEWTSWLVLAVYGSLALYHVVLIVRVAEILFV